MAKLKEATERIGYPVLPVVQQLVKLCKDKFGEWSHWGATTQDITDTATVMQMREALDIVGNEIDAICDALAALAKKYRDTPMAGRSAICSRQCRSPSATRWPRCSLPSSATSSGSRN